MMTKAVATGGGEGDTGGPGVLRVSERKRDWERDSHGNCRAYLIISSWDRGRRTDKLREGAKGGENKDVIGRNSIT